MALGLSGITGINSPSLGLAILQVYPLDHRRIFLGRIASSLAPVSLLLIVALVAGLVCELIAHRIILLSILAIRATIWEATTALLCLTLLSLLNAIGTPWSSAKSHVFAQDLLKGLANLSSGFSAIWICRVLLLAFNGLDAAAKREQDVSRKTDPRVANWFNGAPRFPAAAQ